MENEEIYRSIFPEKDPQKYLNGFVDMKIIIFLHNFELFPNFMALKYPVFCR